jgi:hypothetical protein
MTYNRGMDKEMKMHKLGMVNRNYPWAGVEMILAEGTLAEMIAALRKHPLGELLRVWMPVSNRWATPYEAEMLL